MLYIKLSCNGEEGLFKLDGKAYALHNTMEGIHKYVTPIRNIEGECIKYEISSWNPMGEDRIAIIDLRNVDNSEIYIPSYDGMLKLKYEILTEEQI